MRPIYAFRSENEIAKDLRTLERRLRDRMIAARMAVPFLQQVEPGERPKLPKSIKRLSLNEMAAFVAEEAEQSEPHNGAPRLALRRPRWGALHAPFRSRLVSRE